MATARPQPRPATTRTRRDPPPAPATGAVESLRAINRGLLAAREEEQRRVARELHNTLGQELLVLKISVFNLVAENRPSLGAALAEQLDHTVKRCTELTRLVRTLCYSLYPVPLEAFGLAAALSQLAQDHPAKMTVRMHYPPALDAERFSADVEIALFRIAQEALTNAVKHSLARRIDLRLARRGDRLVLRVIDNGRGFDVPRAREGLGLPTMKQRAMVVNGTVEIESRPGRTVVTAAVPAEPRNEQ